MTIEYLQQLRADTDAARKQHEANANAAIGAMAILDVIIAEAQREEKLETPDTN
mgnify:CR=1 FL=1